MFAHLSTTTFLQTCHILQICHKGNSWNIRQKYKLQSSLVVSVERCKLFVSTSVTKFNTVFLLGKYICMKNDYFAKHFYNKVYSILGMRTSIKSHHMATEQAYNKQRS